MPLRHESWNERLTTRVSAALDATVLRAMQVVVDRALIPDPQDLVNLRQSLAAVLDSGLQHDPGRFFAFLNEPTTPLAVTSRPRRHLLNPQNPQSKIVLLKSHVVAHPDAANSEHLETDPTGWSKRSRRAGFDLRLNSPSKFG